MPLTPFNKVYKNFPSAFAEKFVTLNNTAAKKRPESRRVIPAGCDRNTATTTKKDDKELLRSSASHSALRPISPGPPSEGRERRLTTKRSETPLAALSEGESDDSSNSPRNLSKERRKRESPRPSEDGFNSTWELLYRPKVSRPSPCTTVSLDTVDLWEDSDSDVSDGDNEFDCVNGVAINPRHTVDFAELRRAKTQVQSMKLKKTGLKSQKVRTGGDIVSESKSDKRRSQLPEAPSVIKSPDKQLGLHIREVPSNLDTKAHRPRESQSNDNSDSKPRVRITRKLKCFFPCPAPQIPENLTVETVDTSQPETLPLVNKHYSNSAARSLRRSKSAAADLIKPVRTGLLRESNSADVGQRISRGDCNNAASCVSYAYQRHKTDFTLRLPTPPKEAAPKSAKETAKEERTLPSRKVKFNNFVTVRDGETSKTDTLRNSNNSAQMYKQQYLGHVTGGSGGGSENSEQHPPSGKPPWRVQLVC